MLIVTSFCKQFSAISWWEQFYFEWNDDVRFVLDQHH